MVLRNGKGHEIVERTVVRILASGLIVLNREEEGLKAG